MITAFGLQMPTHSGSKVICDVYQWLQLLDYKCHWITDLSTLTHGPRDIGILHRCSIWGTSPNSGVSRVVGKNHTSKHVYFSLWNACFVVCSSENCWLSYHSCINSNGSQDGCLPKSIWLFHQPLLHLMEWLPMVMGGKFSASSWRRLPSLMTFAIKANWMWLQLLDYPLKEMIDIPVVSGSNFIRNGETA